MTYRILLFNGFKDNDVICYLLHITSIGSITSQTTIEVYNNISLPASEAPPTEVTWCSHSSTNQNILKSTKRTKGVHLVKATSPDLRRRVSCVFNYCGDTIIALNSSSGMCVASSMNGFIILVSIQASSPQLPTPLHSPDLECPEVLTESHNSS